MRRTVLAAALVAGFGGCLAESAQGPGARYSGAGSGAPVCADERPTGSHLTHHVCRTEDDAEQAEAARRTWMNMWKPNPMFGDHTYPGIDQRHPRE